jgi:hypothetical protein
MPIKAPDLTQRPPRSPRVRLGGYVLLPRMLDKGRATLAGKNGEYNYACPLDQRFIEFAGIDPTALKKQLAAGKSDGQVLAWITAKAKNKHSAAEIRAWSAYQEQRTPGDVESRQSTTSTRKPLQTATIARPGSTCSTWMITSVWVGRPDWRLLVCCGPCRLAAQPFSF